MLKKYSPGIIYLLFLFFFTHTVSAQLFGPPDWSYDKAIYEVNIRQYTEEGTIKAFEKHLPRLKELGADIL
jgi:1,4-alpha-glucan branching enzyme